MSISATLCTNGPTARLQLTPPSVERHIPVCCPLLSPTPKMVAAKSVVPSVDIESRLTYDQEHIGPPPPQTSGEAGFVLSSWAHVVPPFVDLNRPRPLSPFAPMSSPSLKPVLVANISPVLAYIVFGFDGSMTILEIAKLA